MNTDNVDHRWHQLEVELTQVRDAIALNVENERRMRQKFLRRTMDKLERLRLVDEWDALDRTIDCLKARARDLGQEIRRIDMEAVNRAVDEHASRNGGDMPATNQSGQDGPREPSD